MTRLAFVAAMEDILGVRRGKLQESDSRDTVEGWSSEVDAQIVALIASELGIEADAEILEAETVGELLSRLQVRHAFAG